MVMYKQESKYIPIRFFSKSKSPKFGKGFEDAKRNSGLCSCHAFFANYVITHFFLGPQVSNSE